MQITIDTTRDNKDEIRKAISLIQEIIGDIPSSRAASPSPSFSTSPLSSSTSSSAPPESGLVQKSEVPSGLTSFNDITSMVSNKNQTQESSSESGVMDINSMLSSMPSEPQSRVPPSPKPSTSSVGSVFDMMNSTPSQEPKKDDDSDESGNPSQGIEIIY